MKKLLLLTAATVFLCAGIKAENIMSSSYLLIDSYPLYSAIGPSAGAADSGIRAAGANPASSAGISDFEFAAMNNMWFGGISNQRLSAAKNFGFGTAGISLSYMDFGAVMRLGIDENLAPIIEGDTVTPDVFSGSVFYGSKISGFSLGGAVNLARENLGAGPVFLPSVSIGVINNELILENLSAGISLLNISTRQYGCFLPLNLKASVKYEVAGGEKKVMDLYAAGSYLPWDNYAGAEGGFDYKIFEILRLRGGVSFSNTGGFKLRGGAGIKIEGINIDYAFVPDPYLGNAHKISIGGSIKTSVSGRETGAPGPKEGGTFESYIKSGDYYYEDKQFKRALRYYEYINLMYWKEIEEMGDTEKSVFYQKMGICYYNLKNNALAARYFKRALYYDRDNEILKHWIKLIK